MIGPDAAAPPPRRLRAHRSARHGVRDRLSEIHYCVLCHERDKDSLLARASATRRARSSPTRSASRWPAARSTRRSPRCTCCASGGDAIGALAHGHDRQPDVPGHRPPHLQRLHEGLHLPEAGAGQHPADRDRRRSPTCCSCRGASRSTACSRAGTRSTCARPYALPYNGRNVLVVGLGPAGYTLAHYLLNEGFGVVAIDGLKIEPLRPRAGRRPGAAAPQPIARWADIYHPARRARARGLRRRLRVRHHRALGQELPHAAPPHAGAARRRCASTAASASAARCRSRTRGRTASTTSPSPPAPASRPIIDMKNNLIRGIRKASDFLMALQLTGAFKRDALANLQVRLPAVVIGGGLTGIDTATELLAYYPVQVEKTPRPATRRWSPSIGEARVRAALRRRGAGHPRRVPGPRPRRARRARARRRGRRAARLRAAGARLGRRDAGLPQAAARTRRPTA